MAFANVPRAGQAQVVWHEWRELLSAVTPWSSVFLGQGRNVETLWKRGAVGKGDFGCMGFVGFSRGFPPCFTWVFVVIGTI